jgi:DNA repair exonuclease SbcCD ATPase subunit
MYEENIRDNIDDFKSDIDAISIEHINDARNLFSEAYKQVQGSNSVPLHFGSKEHLLAELEEFGDDVFNLKSTLGASSLSLPEDREDLQALNDSVRVHIKELQQLNEDLGTIEQQSKAVREALDQTKSELRELLTRKEMNVNE